MDSEKSPYIAVITGDIVNSKKHKGEDRKALDKLLKKGLDTIFNTKEDRTDIFRGDSFQIETSAVSSLRSALKLRSYLKTKRIEVRMAIGIGSIDYAAKNVKRSDGEAYQLSGDEFNELDKNEFLKVTTPWQDLNRILATIVALLDSHFIDFSSQQAEAAFYALSDVQQVEIASIIGISQPAVNSRLKGAKFYALLEGINYFETEVEVIRYTKNYTGTLAYYNLAKDFNQESYDFQNNYGYIYEGLFKNYKKAIELYNKAIEIGPNNVEAYLRKAFALTWYKGKEEKEEIKKCYEKVLKIEPNNFEANFYYSYVLKEYYDDFENSLKHLNIVASQDKNE